MRAGSVGSIAEGALILLGLAEVPQGGASVGLVAT